MAEYHFLIIRLPAAAQYIDNSNVNNTEINAIKKNSKMQECSLNLRDIVVKGLLFRCIPGRRFEAGVHLAETGQRFDELTANFN